MDTTDPTARLADVRAAMRAATLADEGEAVAALMADAQLDEATRARISERATQFVRGVRTSSDPGILESFLAEYGLSTAEGVALMCLAEAMLRVPDATTIDDLIQDKIAPHDWGAHVGDSGSMLVNASTWALMLTGRVLDEDETDAGVVANLRGAVKRLGEPVIRVAVGQAMKEMGAQFVLGRDINEAIRRGRADIKSGNTHSFDMLGEAARTERDAARYFGAYAQAIASIARHAKGDDVRINPGISVKLSALHPRYEMAQREHMLPDLSSRLLQLAQSARHAGIGLNVDAEEADRLDLSLDVIETVLRDPSLAGWHGFGVVVQAYGQRAGHVIDWLHALAEELDRKIMVRLVKGAYWDTEIKRAQVLGLEGFPVFTRKENTDVSYVACARKLLDARERIYPQFATHNAHTVAAVLEMAGNDTTSFEFQRLHGMGETLHRTVAQDAGTRCRIYAPVGAHRDLLAYLVRRLLENGANSSFVNQIVDEDVPAEEIARDPFAQAAANEMPGHPQIATGPELYGAARRNAKGWDLTCPQTLVALERDRAAFSAPHVWHAAPLIAGGLAMTDQPPRAVLNPAMEPAHPDATVGHVRDAQTDDVSTAVAHAVNAAERWASTPVVERAAALLRAASLYETHAAEFFALATREAGKTWLDGVAEVREAVDFLRYYATEAKNAEAGTQARGPIVCISPWNFPLAIFTGQIAAALVTGNPVLAKPAEQTALIAYRAVQLLHEAGIPKDVLQLLPGDGPTVGAALVQAAEVAGVCFTGSTEVARLIERQLAHRGRADSMLIAETGGLNAMLVDSTALPEQAVRDIVASAFQSAGQRCSALRVLYVQRDVEDRLLEMLYGAMDALVVGDPAELATDVGPVIDEEAQTGIRQYLARMESQGRLVRQLETPETGRFIAPAIVRVDGIGAIEREVFGPVLHIATYDAGEIDSVISDINARGYGLTLGLHTRIDARVQSVLSQAHVGNAYVNRNQIGAIVGSQPFGGEGLSGTGPKAGGPHYLRRFRQGALTVTPGQSPASDDAPNVTARQIDDAFASLASAAKVWETAADKISHVRSCLRGRAAGAMNAAAALDLGPIDLPGPTGESNRLTLSARGRVLCIGGDDELVLGHAVQALRAGNSVMVVSPIGGALVSDLVADKRLPILALDGAIVPECLKHIAVDVVGAVGDAETLGAYRRVLAERVGPIVPLVVEAVVPAAFAHERAVCIDTTAAGGNAQLLAASGG